MHWGREGGTKCVRDGGDDGDVRTRPAQFIRIVFVDMCTLMLMFAFFLYFDV